MDRSEDDLVADELAALAGVGGASERIMRLMARVMRKNVHEVELVVPLQAEQALGHVVRILGRAGRGVESAIAEDAADWSTIRVVASGGTGGLNSVVVTALVSMSGQTETVVKLRAAALEGLVKQRAGERIAVRLAAELGK